MDETAAIAEFVTGTTYDDVPADVVEKAKKAIRDTVGVAIYGAQHDVGNAVSTYVEESFPGMDATVIGRGTASTSGAALSNGAFTHAIDYDDTFESIVLHPSGPVFSASLATAEVEGSEDTDLLTAYVVGVETAYRIGHAVYPAHYDHGWHLTGTVGTFGATAAAAWVLGLAVDEIQNAMAIAASSSSSLKKNFGSMTKPLHSGHAAQMGVRAASLARLGFTGDGAILEGDMGYGNVMTPDGTYDPTPITDHLGEEWRGVVDIGFKPYPSGVITHAAMEALRELVLEQDLDPDDVESVTVALDEAASDMLIHAQPDNALQAKFSIEFCLASILREREVGVQEFSDDYVTRPETRAVIEKVERAFEPNLFDHDFAGYGGRVTVVTMDDETHVREISFAPGSESNPLSNDRWKAKFFDCAEAVLEHEDAVATWNAIGDLGEGGALHTLTESIRTE